MFSLRRRAVKDLVTSYCGHIRCEPNTHPWARRAKLDPGVAREDGNRSNGTMHFMPFKTIDVNRSENIRASASLATSIWKLKSPDKINESGDKTIDSR